MDNNVEETLIKIKSDLLDSYKQARVTAKNQILDFLYNDIIGNNNYLVITYNDSPKVISNGMKIYTGDKTEDKKFGPVLASLISFSGDVDVEYGYTRYRIQYLSAITINLDDIIDIKAFEYETDAQLYYECS